LGGIEQARSASDYLAVIVNLSNPVENLPLNDLRAMALVQQTNWPNGRKITLALHEPGPLERRAVLQLVYHMNESAFSRYFLQATFTGRIGTGPRLLSTSENVKRFEFPVPGFRAPS
jgi:phosphate transport system substrate-binding protein